MKTMTRRPHSKTPDTLTFEKFLLMMMMMMLMKMMEVHVDIECESIGEGEGEVQAGVLPCWVPKSGIMIIPFLTS